MDDYVRGLRHGLPIGLGYLSVAFSFGIYAASGGLSVLQATIISMTNLTSAGQLAGLGLIFSAAPLIEMFFVQLIINLRYSLMSLSLSQKMDASMTLGHRLGAGFFITDEVFAVAISQEGRLGNRYLYGLGTLPWIGWALGTVLGTAAGTLLPSAVASSLGIAIYAMFFALVVPPAKKSRAIRAAVLISVLCSLIMRYVPLFRGVSEGISVILCALIGAGICAWRFPIREEAA